MSKDIHLSVIIPCRNQGHVLEKTFTDIENHIKKFDFETEVIYADSASTDNSEEIAEKYKNRFKYFKIVKTPRGKGIAVKSGMKAAEGEIRMFMDADSSTPFKEIDKLLPYFKEGYDIVMGSRYTTKPLPATGGTFRAFGKALKEVIEVIIYGKAKSNTTIKKQGRMRQLISRGGNLVFVVLLGQSFADTRCGFKAYTRTAAETLFSFQTLPGFGFDTEILVIAKKYKFKMIEVPINWYDDAEDTNITMGDTINSFVEIFKVKWNNLRGKYSESK